MSYVIYFCDTETTGLDISKNDIIELSFARLSLDNPDVVDSKTWTIKAVNQESISDEALRVNGHKKEDILHLTKYGKETYLDPADVIAQVEMWVMDDGVSAQNRAFIAHNATFDFEFLKEFWKRANSSDTFPFDRFVIDTMQVVRLLDLCAGKTRNRYNLTSLVKDFKVTKRQAHRAADDVEMLKDVFLKMVLPLIDTIKKNFENSYS